MTAIDDLLAHNDSYVPKHGHNELPTEPQLHLAVLTCMDSRLDLFGALGLQLGQAHLIRNAGGLATDDAIRSLLLSQRLLQTRAIMVIHHTRCGLETFEEETLKQSSKKNTDSAHRSNLVPIKMSTKMSSRPLQPCEAARSSLEQKFVALSSTLTTETCEKSQSRNRIPFSSQGYDWSCFQMF